MAVHSTQTTHPPIHPSTHPPIHPSTKLDDFYKKFLIKNETTPHIQPLWQSSVDDQVSYLLIPKSASSTMKEKINGPICFHSQCPGINSEKMFRFTFIRDPMIRVISAYREIHRRNISVCLDQKGFELPADDASEEELVEHMNLQIQFMMALLQQEWAIDTGRSCDVHPKPQIMFLHGHTNMNMIGCIYDNSERPDFKNITNGQLQYIYEETGSKLFDPNADVLHANQTWKRSGKEAGGTLRGILVFDASERAKHLTKKTKKMIRDFYRDDFEIFEFLCGSNQDPKPMFGINAL